MIKRVVFGEVANSHVAELTDVERARVLDADVLAVAVLIVGIWPAPLVDRMDASIGQL
jgi:NADH-quinone oxidoreductase subunit M